MDPVRDKYSSESADSQKANRISNGMDSLGEILGKRDFKPPDEMTVVKDYVRRHYKSPCTVKMERNALILSVKNSALAATLFLERQTLIEACGLKHRLVIRTTY